MDLSAFDLKGKVALITGGAHGIGFSIAVGMASCGATVCFNCSNEGSLEKGLAAYKEAGVDAHGYVADVTDEAAVNAMVAKIKAEVGPVDILVNNAGLMKRVPMINSSSPVRTSPQPILHLSAESPDVRFAGKQVRRPKPLQLPGQRTPQPRQTPSYPKSNSR